MVLSGKTRDMSPRQHDGSCSQNAEEDFGSASWNLAYLLVLKRRKQPAGYSAHSLSLWDVYRKWTEGTTQWEQQEGQWRNRGQTSCGHLKKKCGGTHARAESSYFTKDFMDLYRKRLTHWRHLFLPTPREAHPPQGCAGAGT